MIASILIGFVILVGGAFVIYAFGRLFGLGFAESLRKVFKLK